MSTVLQDIKHGLRIHARASGLTIVAVVTLALGIGASTAVFSVVNAILLQPLPYPEQDRIVLPWRLAPIGAFLGYDKFPWGERDFHLYWQQTKAFQDIGAFEGSSLNLTGAGEPVQLQGVRASAGFFAALRVAPILGRFYTYAEDQPGHEHVAILSHQLWHDRFNADPSILGRSIELSGEAYTVLGVMPSGFAFPRAEEMPGSLDFPRQAQLWIPLALPAAPPPGPEELAVVGRLRRGVTMKEAQAELDLFALQLERTTPQGKGWFNCRVTPLANQVAGDTRKPLLLILCAVGVVLLIACSNVASLVLTRSIRRRREFSLRAALGADQSRLARQVLTESLILAASGGFAGIVLAEALVYAIKLFGPANIPRLHEVTLDPLVFLFALAVTLMTGLLFGIAPAVAAARASLAETLKEGSPRSGGASSHPRFRNALLVTQVALALVLMIAAGLLVRTFYQMLRTDPGFNSARVLAFELSLPNTRYNSTERIVQLYQKVLQNLRAVPGVEAAGLGETIPMRGAGESTGIRIPGRPPSNAKEQLYAAYTMVSPGYFSAVGTPIVRGRAFLASDTLESMPVTIINSTMARRFWPGQDPIGKQVGPGSIRYPAGTIVGVVADVKHLSLKEEPGPEMYVPFNQKVWPSLLNMQVALRTKSDPVAMTTAVRNAVHQVDPDLPLGNVTTLSNLLDDSMTQPRFAMLLIGAFGMLAVALASIGLYSVISYSVAQRIQEIGIRMALGASRHAVFAMVLKQCAALAGSGIVIGIAGALAVARMMARFLYGVQPTDPLTFVGVSLLLLAIAGAAGWVPARRATRVDPAIALRHE